MSEEGVKAILESIKAIDPEELKRHFQVLDEKKKPEPDKVHELSREEFRAMVQEEVLKVLINEAGINMAALEARMKDHITQVLKGVTEHMNEFIKTSVESHKAEFMKELAKL